MAHEIFIYDIIGKSDWMPTVSAEFIRDELKVAKDSPVLVRINSEGGDVFEGVAMYNLLLGHKPGVDVVIDSLAASAAAWVAMAGRTIEVAESGFVMVHNSMTMTFGNSGDHTKQIERLSKADDMIRNIFVSRTGSTLDKVTALMDAETWMTAQEAVDHGFATKIGQRNNVKPKAIKDGLYRNTPQNLLESPGETQSRERLKRLEYANRIRLTKAGR